MTETAAIDRKDTRILQLLQDDGRLSLAELSDRIALSPTATAARLKRLVQDGYILGFSARLDPRKLERGLVVFVEVKLDRTNEDVFAAFAAAAQGNADIMECHMVAGGFDYLLKARVKDMAAYRAFLAKALADMPGIRETHTYPVMEEIKDTAAIAF